MGGSCSRYVVISLVTLIGLLVLLNWAFDWGRSDPVPDSPFRAVAINDSGQIVGVESDPETGGTRALLWDEGAVTVLKPLPGDGWAEAADINTAGQIVGWSYASTAQGLWRCPLPFFGRTASRSPSGRC